jgi:hypothetical protein
MESERKAKIVIAKKLDAALRQLETAIWLFFNDGDLVSIKTLAGAAHGILDDLLHHHKKGRAYPFENAPEGMTDRDWRNLVKEGQDFAKHARKDPFGSQAYSDDELEMFIFFVLLARIKLTDSEKPHGLESLFIFWYGIRHPDFFSVTIPKSFRHGDEVFDIETLKNLPAAEFYQKVRKFSVEYVGHPPRPDYGSSPHDTPPAL